MQVLKSSQYWGWRPRYMSPVRIGGGGRGICRVQYWGRRQRYLKSPVSIREEAE